MFTAFSKFYLTGLRAKIMALWIVKIADPLPKLTSHTMRGLIKGPAYRPMVTLEEL